MSSIPPEMARMWADQIAQHLLEYVLMDLGVLDDPGLADILDRFDATAHDIREGADRG